MELIIILLFASIRMSLPVFFAATGGYFSEKSGVPQIALEAYLLTGAFVAATFQYFYGTILIAYLFSVIVCALYSQIFCILIFKLKANPIVIGTGMNLLTMGLIPLLSKVIFDSTGSTPAILTDATKLNNIFVCVLVFVLTLILFGYWLAEKSKWGLQIKFAGEKSEALLSAGVSPMVRRWQAVTLCASITGVGGAILSTYLASSYSPMMSAGRGFMALAAVIFSGWSLPKAWIVVLFFGFAEALQIYLQSLFQFFHLQIQIPNEFIQVLPYILTLFALLLVKNKQLAPKEIGTSL